MKTRAEPLGYEIIVGDPEKDLVYSKVFGAIFQYGTFGLRDFTHHIDELHNNQASQYCCRSISSRLC